MVPPDAPLPPIVCLGTASDREARDALGRHLLSAQFGGRLRYWHPGLLSPNADPLRTTRQQLREASLVLVLLSDRYYSDHGLADHRGLLPALPPGLLRVDSVQHAPRRLTRPRPMLAERVGSRRTRKR